MEIGLLVVAFIVVMIFIKISQDKPGIIDLFLIKNCDDDPLEIIHQDLLSYRERKN